MIAETYRGFDRDAYKLLATSAVRRLWLMRADSDARRALREWLADLRRLRA